MRAGIGLLLLRAAAGIVVLLPGAAELSAHPDPGAWLIGAAAVAGGILLLIGFLTPVAALLAMVPGARLWISVAPAASAGLLTSKASAAFLVAVALALALLGPGAFSVDGRLFGLREIIIPSSRPRSE